MQLPFQTYEEAKTFFGIPIPVAFYEGLVSVQQYYVESGVQSPEFLLELFGIDRLVGEAGRYLQTPIEFFPFASMGVDGVHFGFVVHELGQSNYPAGAFSPADDYGLIVLAQQHQSLFQSLLWNPAMLEKHAPLLNLLGLEAEVFKLDPAKGKGLQIIPKPDWTFLPTRDGLGVYAESQYFEAEIRHIEYDKEAYWGQAKQMQKKGRYGSQLFYLKELFWEAWSDYEFAIELLQAMLTPFEQLGRAHLHQMTERKIEAFRQALKKQ